MFQMFASVFLGNLGIQKNWMVEKWIAGGYNPQISTLW